MTRHARTMDLLQPPHRWWHAFKLSTQKFAVVLTIAAFGLGLGYVWLTNTTASVGFSIEKLQQQVADLKNQNEQLELRAADLQSLSSAQASSQSFALQPTDHFDVLPTTTGAVAVGP